MSEKVFKTKNYIFKLILTLKLHYWFIKPKLITKIIFNLVYKFKNFRKQFLRNKKCF